MNGFLASGGCLGMTRVSLVHAVLGAVVVVATSARSSWAQQPTKPPETLIRLSVSPAPAPKPALRYALLPELSELEPGNPVQGYLKCYLEQYRFVFDEDEFDRRKTLLAMPLEELPAADSRELGRLALVQLDRAARLDNPDWQVLLKLRADGFFTALPDVQGMRTLARALHVRLRAEVAGGRVDDAIRTAKTMFAMARHVGDHPTVIGNLVGWSIANMAFLPLGELLEHPDCPNLYWALSHLPDPLIPTRRAVDGERMMCAAYFHKLNSDAPMTAQQIQEFIVPLDRLIGEDKPVIWQRLASRMKDEQRIVAARKRLAQSGLPEVRLIAFPPEQVILLDEAREGLARFDELAKTTVFSAWQFETFLEKSNALHKESAPLADALIAAIPIVRRLQGRLKQRIDLLRHVEALRMYAAEHGGKFPAKLALLSVPLPDDPFTGKPFPYESSGKTAHLHGTPPAAEKDVKEYRIHYEITLKN
jgi:hypothetical protein